MPVKARKPKFPMYCPAWFVQAAEGMVRNNVSLKVAAGDLGITLDPDELDRISRRPEFKEIVRAESNKYYASVANDPTRTKSTALGKMWVQAEMLHQQGDFDKAAAVIERIAKIEGWTGSDTNVNVFANLTAKDIDSEIKKIQAEIPPEIPVAQA